MTRRAELRRQARLDAKLDRYADNNHWPFSPVMHGPCRRCPKRTYLMRPAKICTNCARDMAAWLYAANFFGVKL